MYICELQYSIILSFKHFHKFYIPKKIFTPLNNLKHLLITSAINY